MYYEEVSWYSDRLKRNMRIKVYGHYGPAFIAFPCQDKQSDDFDNHRMIAALSQYIEEGRMKLFCLDSIGSAIYFADLDYLTDIMKGIWFY